MSSGVFYPAASGDDGYITSINEFIAGGNPCIYLGRYSDQTTQKCWCRLQNVTIPGGATIDAAVLRLTAYETRSTATCSVLVQAVAEDDPSAPASLSDFNARTLTSATALWTVPAFTDGTQYDSVDLSAVIQEIVSRDGWTSGSSILLYLADDGGDAGAFRCYSPYSYSSGAEKPELHVSWSNPIQGATIVWTGNAPTMARCVVSAAAAISWEGSTLQRPWVTRRACGIQGIPVYRRICGAHLAPGVAHRLCGSHALPGIVARRACGSHIIPAIVGRRICGIHALLDHTPISRRVCGAHALPSTTSAVGAASLTGADDLVALTISGDRDSFAWSVDLTLADAAAHAAYARGTRVDLTVGGQPMAVIIEGRSVSRAYGKAEYKATGRTLSALLDAPWAASVTKTWGATTAATAAAELCTACGLDLAWNVVDWVIPAGRLTATAESPASIVSRLAAACGAVVQPTLAGGVRVIYRYPVGVTELDAATPVATLDGDVSVTEVAEDYEGRSGYDAVTVVDDRAATAAYLSVTADEARNAGRDAVPPGEAYYLRVAHETDYAFRVTSGTMELVALDETEALSATVSFEDADTADLEALVASVEAVTWYGTDLGDVSPNGGASVILASGAGLGVALIEYTTRYDVWRFTPDSLGDAFSVLALCEAEDMLADDTDSGGLRLTVQRGAGASPDPDELSLDLACSVAAATQAGRNHLDEVGQNVLTVSVTSWPIDGDVLPLPGEVVAVDDGEATWRATVTGWSLGIEVQDGGAVLATMTTTVERPQ